jgi:hypothetical protein
MNRDGRTDRQTDRQTETHRHTHTFTQLTNRIPIYSWLVHGIFKDAVSTTEVTIYRRIKWRMIKYGRMKKTGEEAGLLVACFSHTDSAKILTQIQ